MELLSHSIEKIVKKQLDVRKKQQILNVLKTEIYPDTIVIPTKVCQFPELKESEKENEASIVNIEEEVENKNKHRIRKARSRRSLRYMTQPISLVEIRETDETTDNLINTNEILVTNDETNEDSSTHQKDTVILNKIFNDLQMTDWRHTHRRSFRKFN
jgi:hypothetical protein